MTPRWMLLIFSLAVAAVLGALAFISARVLNLERREADARADARVQEATRLALWRMDSAVGALIAKESARPYFEYQPFYAADRAYTRMYEDVRAGEVLVPSPLLLGPGPYLRLHFQRSADGMLASPQVPTGNMRDLAEADYIPSESVIDAEAALQQLAAMLPPPAFTGEQLAEGRERAPAKSFIADATIEIRDRWSESDDAPGEKVLATMFAGKSPAGVSQSLKEFEARAQAAEFASNNPQTGRRGGVVLRVARLPDGRMVRLVEESRSVWTQDDADKRPQPAEDQSGRVAETAPADAAGIEVEAKKQTTAALPTAAPPSASPAPQVASAPPPPAAAEPAPSAKPAEPSPQPAVANKTEDADAGRARAEVTASKDATPDAVARKPDDAEITRAREQALPAKNATPDAAAAKHAAPSTPAPATPARPQARHASPSPGERAISVAPAGPSSGISPSAHPPPAPPGTPVGSGGGVLPSPQPVPAGAPHAGLVAPAEKTPSTPAGPRADEAPAPRQETATSQLDLLLSAAGDKAGAAIILGHIDVAPPSPLPRPYQITPAIELSGFAPAWIDPPHDSTDAPAAPAAPHTPASAPAPYSTDTNLIFTRTIRAAGSTFDQGLWVDWPRLRAFLLDGVQDLTPGATLTPVPAAKPDDAAAFGRRLASIPAELRWTPPPTTLPSLLAFTPARTTLALAWLAALVAIGAIALVLRASSDLAERRGRFVSAVTHELRTPLTTFCMYSHMLADGMVTADDARRDYLQTLKQEAGRLSRIVENVLEYARLGRKKKGRPVEAIAATDLLARVEPALRLRAEQSGAVLHVHTPGPSDAAVRADPATIERILYNLVDNACKYALHAPPPLPAGEVSCESSSMTEGVRVTPPSIELSLHIDPRSVVFSVRDHGPGIPPRERAAIFKPFHRGAAQGDGSIPGLGLGLALARGLAHHLAGELRLRPCDHGTILDLELPRANA